MTLTARSRRVEGEAAAQELVVACPQRIDPVSIRECAQCELCEGLSLDGRVQVRCGVAPAEHENGAPPAHAPVTAIMTTPVVSIGEGASAQNVKWLLLARNIGAVPVVDAERRPIGVVAKTDLLGDHDERAYSALPKEPSELELAMLEDPSGLRARDVMTPVVHALREDASIAAAAGLMAHERVHHVVVVDPGGRLSGIVSTLDIARWVAARERFTPRRASRA